MLNTPVEQLPYVGDRARLLHRLHLRTAADLIFCFPRDYQDLSDHRPIAQLDDENLQSVTGTVTEVAVSSRGFGKHRVSILLEDDTGAVRATWFNQPYMQKKFQRGQRLLLTAKPRMRGLQWEMAHPQITWLDQEETTGDKQLAPVYPLTEGLSQYHMRRIVGEAANEFADVPEEVFEPALRERYHLIPIADAVRQIHAPSDHAELEAARRRFVFQELFVLQLAVAIRRAQQRVTPAPPLPCNAKLDGRIRRLLPFELTDSQNEVIAEVTADLALQRPMNRLLQGDVGSGKTVVALYAMLVAVAGGTQATLMAPTEVLARQHAHTLDSLLEASRVRHAVLTGGTPKVQRDEITAQIEAGEVDVVLGTHAVIQDSVRFKNLGLVVVDEQHKFGVRQRAALRQGELSPHYLVMTATPIPRTVTMALFGDLDVSVLRHSPEGRQQVQTYLVEPHTQQRWWAFVRDRLREGRQAYVVAPLVEESENISAPSVAEAFETLSNGELHEFRTDLLHGRMSAAEKQAAMRRFRSGETQVLVSTTVIEVGVDVPNATVMTVDGAERFGLAQLHQLRGRVGRGTHAAYCGVLLGENSEQGRERLEAFAKCHSGFELAELDFELRGPGDLFGTQQHGLPPLRIADLRRDHDLLEEASREAQLLVAEDPGLEHDRHAGLRHQVMYRYGEALDLGDVG